MSNRCFISRLFTVVLAISTVFSSVAPALHAQEGNRVYLPLINSNVDDNGSTDLLFRTRISPQTPAQWRDLTRLEAVHNPDCRGWCRYRWR